MASRILANLIVSGGQVLLRAAAAAYQKALVSACPLRALTRHDRACRILGRSPRASRTDTAPSPALTFLPLPSRRRATFGRRERGREGWLGVHVQPEDHVHRRGALDLGVDAQCTLEDVAGRYAKMFAANEKNGAFTSQSKIHRAKERMDLEFLGEGGDRDGDARAGDGADAAGDAEKNPNAGRGICRRRRGRRAQKVSVAFRPFPARREPRLSSLHVALDER